MIPDQSATGASAGFFTRWVNELCFTWFGIVLIAVVPAVLFGSAIFSVGVLAATVLIGLPYALSRSTAKDSGDRSFRRIAVMLLVSALTLICVAGVDEQIPKSAASLTQAIESFRHDTGHYPESLGVLIPEYLEELPDVRFSIIQPLITYRVTNGKPFLAIPSAMGDMFAKYVYDFEAKVWNHQS